MGLPIIEEKKKNSSQKYDDRVVFLNQNFEKLNPLKNIQGSIRIERSFALLKNHSVLKNSAIADIGCGTHTLASLIEKEGANITLIDVYPNELLKPNLTYVQASLPHLPFADKLFKGIVCTEVIAEIEPHLYRLTVSEWARILEKNGWLLCSTEIDLYSYDAKERFLDLIKTEFEVVATKKSYHRLYLFLVRFFKAPQRFKRGGEEKKYREELLIRRRSFFKILFYLNTLKGISFCWTPIASLFRPLLKHLQKNRSFFLFCERVSDFIWGDNGVSHIIVLARKKGM